MQPSYSLIAVGIGAVIALCPISSAASQTASSDSSTPTHLSESALSETDSVELVQSPATPTDDTAPNTTSPDTTTPNSTAPDRTDSEGGSLGSPALDRPASESTEPDVTTPDAAASDSSDDSLPSLEPAAENNPSSEPSISDEGSDPFPEISEPTPSEATEASPTPADTEQIPVPESLPETDPELLLAPPSGDETSTLNLEYLDGSPNPLQFPTRPEEVEVVGTQPITLEEALELAQRNSRELQATQLELERNRAALRQARAANFPTLDVGASVNTQEQQQASGAQLNPVTGQIEGGETTTSLATTLSGAVQLNYDLYTAGRRSAAIRAAERQVRFQELQLETVAEELRLNVTTDYYDMQEADEQVRIARTALAEAERSLRDAQALESAGVGTRFDVLQAQVDVANSRQELTQRLSQQQIARRQLVQRIGLGQSVDVSSADPVAVADLWNLTLEESIVLAYRNRAELEQQLVQREISRQQRRAALADRRPQVSLFANYNVQNQLDSDEGFSDTYQFGARVDWRLFDAGASSAAADQEEANIAIAETQFANSRNQVRFQVEQAYYNLQANFDNIQTASLAVEQATESLRLARLRFQAGVGTQTDVLRSQTELTRAELNRVQAILGYNRSLAELQRAVSNLPDTDLAEVP